MVNVVPCKCRLKLKKIGPNCNGLVLFLFVVEIYSIAWYYIHHGSAQLVTNTSLPLPAHVRFNAFSSNMCSSVTTPPGMR